MKRIKIGQAFSTIRNGASIKQDKLVDGVPITRIETIADGLIDLNRLGYASVKGESYENFYLKDGDILMSHINSISHLGKVAIFENRNEKIIHGMNLLCLKANSEKLLPKYVFYYLKSLQFRSSIKKITKKSVNQASFNISNLKEIEIPIPETLFDQIRIANILNKAENLISQRKESIRLLDEYLKSTFLEMFGQYLKRDDNIQLSSICTKITDGTHDTPLRLTSGIKFITGKHIRPFVIDYDNSDYVTEEVHKQVFKRCNPEYGDILYTNIGVNLGTAAMNTVRYEFSMKNVALLKPDSKKINSRYLEHILNLEQQKCKILSAGGAGGAQMFLSLKQIRDIKIPSSTIELQNLFANIVEKAEALKVQYQQSLKELENLYACLSQRAFRGELSLKKEKLMMAAEPEVRYIGSHLEGLSE